MAGATELLREFVSAHHAGIENAFVLKLLGLHRRHMLRAWSMTCFTGYSGHQPIQLQLISVGGGGAVTGKAIACLVHADPSARSDVKGWRCVARIAHGEIQTLNVIVETDTAFAERAIMPEDVGLSRLTLAEAVEYRLGDCVNSVGYGVQALVAAAHNLVNIWSAAKCQARMRA